MDPGSHVARGPSNEHFWQDWLKSVQRFQRRRVKCEKLTDGRRTLTHDKSSHAGELKSNETSSLYIIVLVMKYYESFLTKRFYI
jgi:hypothetical protein